MTKFVGMEYVIACMLIEQKRKGIDIVPVTDLYELGIEIQQLSFTQELDAVFLVSEPDLEEAIYDFSDYFSINRNTDGEIESISIMQGKEVEDLKRRFVGYIPLQILRVIEQALEEMVA